MKEENIVKQTAKALGMTQKELAKDMGVSEDTVSNWSRGKIETPQWTLRMFKLLLTEKKYNTIKRLLSDEMD